MADIRIKYDGAYPNLCSGHLEVYSAHSDQTVTRIETINTCDSLDEFLDKLWNYLEEESDRMDQ